MKKLDDRLLTPIYVKQSLDDAWPLDEVFYALTGDGMFLCRNDRFFHCAIRARRPPCELAAQEQFLRISYPLIPQTLLEQAVGFCDWAYRGRGAECVLLVVWNEANGEVQLISPEQTARSYRNARGAIYPDSVRYIVPHPLPDGCVVLGDLHSHGHMSAYASVTDELDDAKFNGLHLVVGRLDEEPPQWHLEAVVDGARFTVPRQRIFAGYQCRNHDFPVEWSQRHTVEYSGPGAPAVGSTPPNRTGGTHLAPPPDSSAKGRGTTGWGGRPASNDAGPGRASSHGPFFDGA